MIKNLKENKSGNANIIILAIMTVILGFGMLTIGSYIYYAIASSADAGSIIVSPEVKATGSFAFNGSNYTSANNDLAGSLVALNITYGTANYIFEFNTTTVGSPTCRMGNCILVAQMYKNNSLNGATNLSAVINANTSAGAIVTASVSGNTTIITADVAGVLGNSVILTESIVPTGQAGWVATTTLANGKDAVTGQTSQDNLNSYVGVVFPLFGLALMILGFSVILITLRKNFGGGEVR